MRNILRQLSIVAALLVIVGAVFISNSLSAKKEPPPREKTTKKTSIKTVQVSEVENRAIASNLQVQGRLAAFDKIDIFSEVTGTLISTDKPFKVGTYFKKDDVLLRVDDEESRLNLLAQKSSLMNAITQMMPDLKIDYPESFPQWKNYLDQFDVKNGIREFPRAVTDKEKYFIASKNIQNQFYTIKSAESRLRKFVIYAPFSGVITEAGINAGSLVRAGQKMGMLMNTSNYELEATVSMADLKYIKTGNSVQLRSDDIRGSWTGRVKRISNVLDPNTQSIIVYIGVSGQNLREGMYLRGDINVSSIAQATKVANDLLVNENNIFIVQDSTLKLMPIAVVKTDGETSVIRGLPEGSKILRQKLSGAYDGMKVQVE